MELFITDIDYNERIFLISVKNDQYFNIEEVEE